MTELCQLPFSQRIDTVLQNCHIVARGGARAYLRQHEVRAWIPKDRAWGPVTSSSTGVDPSTVQVDGAPLPWTSPVHLVMHKPAGFTCTHAANEGDTVRVDRHSCDNGAGGQRCGWLHVLACCWLPQVFDLLPPAFGESRPQLNTIGRLDKATTGLLLMTQHGTCSKHGEPATAGKHVTTWTP